MAQTLHRLNLLVNEHEAVMKLAASISSGGINRSINPRSSEPMRHLLMLCTLAVVCALAVGGYAIAQDGTPTPATGADPCATPQASPMSGTPATTVPAASPSTPEASPTAANCGTPESTTGGTTGAIVIEMVDIAFNPTNITIPANTDVVIELPNKGALSHNFNVDKLGIKTEDVPGGGSTTVTIKAAPGTYEFYCSVPGHKDIGMIGTLTVQ